MTRLFAKPVLSVAFALAALFVGGSLHSAWAGERAPDISNLKKHDIMDPKSLQGQNLVQIYNENGCERGTILPDANRLGPGYEKKQQTIRGYSGQMYLRNAKTGHTYKLTY